MYPIMKYSLLPLMILALLTAANAQSRYQDPERCKAEMIELDKDGDGYISDEEMGEYGRISTRVDTDGDGRISRDELVVACDSNLVEALTRE